MVNSLDIQLQNQTNSGQVWAYVTGIAIQNNWRRMFIKANGSDIYYPEQVSVIGSPLAEDCAIPLGPPGSTTTVHIPQMAGGRIWFACDSKLQFFLNPGPAVVEPSVLNPSDPNAHVNFGFAEFTLNGDQLFANISYVDFVSRLPISMTLQTMGGAVQHVSGMPANGIDQMCDGLRSQAAKDGWPWDRLVVQPKGQPVLRVLNPTHGDAAGASFAGYYEPYVDQVWSRYSSSSPNQMRINTQAAAGVVTGQINNDGQLMFGNDPFQKPNSADIFGCNSGPFTTGPSSYRNSIIPRLAAAFQRSALLSVDDHPSDPSTFYMRDPTNHYCRIVHEVNLDGKGYAFAYDDVQPDWGADQSGKVNAGDPQTFIVAVGGNNAYVGDTQAIDDVYRSTSKCDDPEKTAEGKKIVDELARLKYEVQHDRQLTPIRDDGFPDVEIYNKELEQLGNPGWLNVNWLYCECYLFRRMSTSFSLSKHWKNYDVFARQKINTFRSSRPAVIELAARYKTLLDQIEKGRGKPADEEAEEIIFHEMCEICLWGNATDLSLLTNLTYEDIQKLQGSEARKAAEKNILVNNLPAAYKVLKKEKAEGKKERRVDIVLDNAGFELFVDLILVGYLLSSGLATLVVLHPKDIPWFVSDVLPSDFSELLNALANPKKFYETPSEDEKLQDKTPEPLSDKESEDLSFLFQSWGQMYAEGQVILRPNRFWTHPGSFWRLPHVAEELYEDLKTSNLVIFKGDLNYRKLTGDAKWDASTPFVEAIGPLGPGSGLNVLALRTCKADVVVDLQAGKDEELRATEGGGGDSGARKWAWNGKWAVVSLSTGK